RATSGASASSSRPRVGFPATTPASRSSPEGRPTKEQLMEFGRYLEDFEVGDVYKHWPGKTITQAEDILFCAITMNQHPLHSDDNYAAAASPSGRAMVVGNLVYSIVLGQS